MPANGLAQVEHATSTMAPTNRRFRIMGLLFVTVVINYLDRSNISIAAPSLASDFHLDPVQLGLVFSAFSWTYTPFQLPGGWLVDRVHPRILYPVTIMLWSLATLSLGLANGLVIADRAAHGGGLLRGADLPDQQPDRHDVVRREGTCHLHRRLYGGGVGRAWPS